MHNVTILSTPEEAFFNYEVVITMLADDVAMRNVIMESGALTQAKPGVIHIVMSTISPSLVGEMLTLHEKAQISYVAAPVFGIPAVAARAELTILVAGAEQSIDKVKPIFDVISRRIWRLGTDPRQANIAKIAGNMMITLAMESMIEASKLTESYGLAVPHFLEMMTQTLFACPLYQRYGNNISKRQYEPGFKLILGLKDIDLALQAATDKKLVLSSAQIVRDHMYSAVCDGLGEKDWSSFTEAAYLRNPSIEA